MGSLLRPDYLIDARRQLENGEIDPPAFKILEDRSTRRSSCRRPPGSMSSQTVSSDAMPSDPEKLIDTCIEMDNTSIAGHPDVTFAMHICRGNNQSKFYAAGDYEPIARIFKRTRFNRFLLEYDDQRSGGFAPLRHVPEDCVVVLGLVTTKKPALEAEEELKRRIEEASQYVPLQRLALSPQCGFASTMEGNRITSDHQRHKLELVARVARSVWG